MTRVPRGLGLWIVAATLAGWPVRGAEDRPAADPLPTEVGHETVSRIAKGPNSAFLLRFPVEPPLTDLEAGRGLLAREIVRQAVLIAARDGLGRSTRDGGIEETGDVEVFAEVASQFPKDGSGSLALRLLRGAGRQTLLDRPLPPSAGGVVDYPKLVEVAEGLSRAELPEALGRAGFDALPVHPKGDARVPEGVAAPLETLTTVAQFGALRAVHQAIREGGESPALLGALARAYGNLGILTEFHWSAAHKVFKARSLLYAERMVRSSEPSAEALRHRAYARALAGLPAAALADLEAARGVAGAGEAPAWATAIEAFASLDDGRLGEMAEGGKPGASWASLLRFLAAERSNANVDPGSHDVASAFMARTGRAAVKANPLCLRLLTGLGEARSFAAMHFATAAAPEVLSTMIAEQLPGLPGLPAKARDLAAREADEPLLVRSLLAAGGVGEDGGEPSWGVLGRLIRDARFALVDRRAKFMAEAWAVPVDEYLETTASLVADHPYRDVLRVYAAKPGETPKLVTIVDWEKTEYDYLPRVMKVDTNISGWAYQGLQGHEEALDRDLGYMIAYAPEVERRAEMARRLRVVSPRSPLGAAGLIEYDWAAAEPQAAAWEREFGNAPAVLEALGRRYAKLNRPADAGRCYEAFVRISPDGWAYQALAKLRKAAGDVDGWKAALDAYMAQPDTGLGHARAQVEFAEHYMKLGQYDLAKPYADAAAATWSRWGMACAVLCEEGLRNWEGAETWARRISERYENGRLDWLLWCARTHRGDVRAAIRQGLTRPDAPPEDLDAAECSYLTLLRTLDDQPRPALEAARQAYLKGNRDLWFSFELAFAADRVGESALRDEALKQIVENPKNAGFKMRTLAEMFQKELAEGAGHPLDLKAVDALRDQLGPEHSGNFSWMVGTFLDLRGRGEQAVPYYQGCSRTPPSVDRALIYSAEALRKRGIDPPMWQGGDKPAGP